MYYADVQLRARQRLHTHYQLHRGLHRGKDLLHAEWIFEHRHAKLSEGVWICAALGGCCREWVRDSLYGVCHVYYETIPILGVLSALRICMLFLE